MSRDRVRRLPLLLVLVFVALAAYVAGDADPAPTTADANTNAIAAPAEGTTSAAWFCAGSADDVPLGSESVWLANLAGDPTRVMTTVHPDDGAAPVTQWIELDPRTTRRIGRDSLGPRGGLVVETFGPDVVVESAISDSTRAAVDQCPTAPATAWSFAAGTTVVGVEQHLVLFNPLGSDAKVDIRVLTGDGAQEPEALQSLDVPRRSRLIVPVHEHAVRTPRVAVEVHATLGSVVAQQTIAFAERAGTPGVARSNGTTAAAGTWTLPHVTTVTGSEAFVAVANPGEADAPVDVIAVASDRDTVIEPLAVTVPASRVVWVRIGSCPEEPDPDTPCLPVAADKTLAVTVLAASAEVQVVAQHVARYDTDDRRGALAASGAATGARRWYLATTRVRDVSSGSIVLASAGATEATVDIALVRAGEVERPESLQGIAVPPGPPRRISLGDALERNTAVLVTASDDVVVQRTLAGGEITSSLAIPARDGSP